MIGDWPGPPPWDRRPTFALDADVTVYWPAVRPCWEENLVDVSTHDPVFAGLNGSEHP